MRYIFGVFAVVVLLILAVVLIFRRSPSTTNDQSQTVKRQIVLAEYEAKPVTAQLTIRGEITADEDRRAIRVSVSKQERSVEILQGYNEAVVSRQTFPNNANAFAIFLSALDTAGFALEKETAFKDERGVCPKGLRFVYRLQEGSKQVLRSWSTSCGRQQGSFGGHADVVRSLFQKQIPEYRDITRDVRL